MKLGRQARGYSVKSIPDQSKKKTTFDSVQGIKTGTHWRKASGSLTNVPTLIFSTVEHLRHMYLTEREREEIWSLKSGGRWLKSDPVFCRKKEKTIGKMAFF